MRIVQRGSSRDLAILYLVGPQCDADIRAALGPTPWVVAFDDKNGHRPADAAKFLEQEGLHEIHSLCLVGYSAGAQAVRAALLKPGDLPGARFAAVAIDGAHASMPAERWQIDVWKDIAERARAGEALLVITATAQTYVESLPAPYLSTLTVLRKVFAPHIEPGDEIHERDLHVHAYRSKAADKKAHADQQRVVMPEMLRLYVRPWLERSAEAPPVVCKHAVKSLGERALAVIMLKVGQRETVPNKGPIVEWAMRGCVRRSPKGVEVRLGVLGPWCAGTVGASERDAALPGEQIPTWRGAVWEAVRDALEDGTWRDVGAYMPKPGDLGVYKRSGGDPRVPGQEGHIGRVLRAPIDGAYATVDGNINDAVSIVERRLDDPLLVGWVVRT